MKLFRSALVAALAIATLSSQVYAADNYTIKDSAGVTKTIRAKDAAGVLATAHTSANADGTTLVDPATAANQSTANGYLATISAAAADTSTPSPIGGNVAHDAVDAGNPVKMGCYAATADPTAVSSADRSNVLCDTTGRIVTTPYALRTNLVSGTTGSMTGTTSTLVLAAPGAGLFNYITNLTCVNSHATVGTFVTIQDGSGGAAIYTVAAGAVYQGATLSFPAPLKQPTANTGLYVADATTGAAVICSASGFKG